MATQYIYPVDIDEMDGAWTDKDGNVGAASPTMIDDNANTADGIKIVLASTGGDQEWGGGGIASFLADGQAILGIANSALIEIYAAATEEDIATLRVIGTRTLADDTISVGGLAWYQLACSGEPPTQSDLDSLILQVVAGDNSNPTAFLTVYSMRLAIDYNPFATNKGRSFMGFF
jgi:hypothetical protein